MGSCFIGSAFGLLSSLFYRYAQFRKESEYNIVEACLLVPVPVAAYMAAEAAGLSGIVSILFCGIVMASYTRQNLTETTSKMSLSFFKVVAKVAETFVFIYMGLSLFLGHQTFTMPSMWFMFIVSFIAMLMARVANVYPNCFIVNLRRSPREKISKNHQLFLWFSGLRGAIAFALAMKSTNDVGEEAGGVMFSTTLLIVLVTVIIFGGMTPFMLSKLDVLDKSNGDTPYGTPSYHNLDSEHQRMKDHQSDRDMGEVDMSEVEMSELELSADVSSMALQTDVGSSSDTPLRKFIRTASGKINVQEIDKTIHKVFVSPE